MYYFTQSLQKCTCHERRENACHRYLANLRHTSPDVRSDWQRKAQMRYLVLQLIWARY